MVARAIRDGKAQGAMLPVLYEFPEDIANDTADPPAWQDSRKWWMVTPNRDRSVTIKRLEDDWAQAKAKGQGEIIRWASQHLNIEIGLALRSDRWVGADLWQRAADRSLTLDALIERSEVVVIGIHGFCGASIDYNNFGQHLLKHQPTTALYAYEIRGQGSDPIFARRGDIGDPRDWYRDLFAFTGLVRERHPDAKIVWFGESMGALIAAHAWRQAPLDQAPCDGLILSSPIVRFRDDIPAWTPGLVQIAATTLPLARKMFSHADFVDFNIDTTFVERTF
jgi:hypothetical protein